ncbi:type I restriction enzyme HsdR N-terminal domain-containing protein [Leptolyngbya iicbica]|uniref:Restriction endonuclease type I HsdR N-terminal domain-containing protein n=2 Tax=Cyanophyceae TaxID=3028117 RepID=A0A4Q7EGI2_9CYAN|nr:type I restriction enzyme HsdR N-terminal domain-containing protein [Leptolyngbya sp. LK]RZM82166.1 hypothetical protein DYY88_02600 [Leptolyngbya sp. LK]
MVKVPADDYADLLDSLALALESSYMNMKDSSLSIDEYEYSGVLINRLQAFYCAQDTIKKFLGKRVAQAGADFFVESVLFLLRIFNDVEALDFEISSELPVKRKRNAIRPDISIWKDGELLAIIECKTQLGWLRNNWKQHFEEREKSLKEVFPDAQFLVFVMTGCNWSGFGEQNVSIEHRKFFCFLKDAWPAHLSKEFDSSLFESPVEDLMQRLKFLSS